MSSLQRQRVARGGPVFLALLAGAVLALAVPSAGTATATATRTVTIDLSTTGKATWTVSGGVENSSVTMTYSWHGTLRFAVSTKALRAKPATFSARASGTLVGSWTGKYEGTLSEGAPQGPFRCIYNGRGAEVPIGAVLKNASLRTRVQIVMHPRTRGFFQPKGEKAAVECTNSVGEDGPPHFDPSWLFRDTVTLRGQLTRNTAIIAFPAKLLPKGRTTVRFPYEVGRRNSGFTGNTTWRNVGRVVVRAS